MRLQTPPLLLALAAIAALALACQSDEAKLADFLERGKQALDSEQYEEAVIEYRNVLQIDPNNAEAHFALAKSYTQLQKLKEAYWELHESVRLDPDNREARVSYAQFSLIARDYDEVLAQADAILEREPSFAAAYTLRGQAIAALERFDEASEAFAKAVELSDEEDLPGHLLNVIQYETGRGNNEAAKQYIDRLVEVDPGYRSYASLARYYARSGEPEKAEEAFRKSLDFAQKKNRAAAYRTLAAFYFNQGRPDEGAATLEKGIGDVDEGKLDLIYMLASFYRSQGDEQKADAMMVRATEAEPDAVEPLLILSSYRGRKGEIDLALEAVDRALALEPENRGAQLRRAELLVDSGYHKKDPALVDEGRSIVEGVLAEEPSNPEALFVRAKSEMAELDPKAAVATLRSALDVRPDWAQARFVLGSALMMLGDRNGARAELARAVELDPSQLEARRALARIHAALGEHEYAIEQGRQYLKAKPDDASMRILVAQSLVALGKRDEAYEELAKIPSEERNADSWYAYARLQLSEGKVDEARAALMKANELQPNHPEILRWLHRIDVATGRGEESKQRILAAVEAEPDNAALVRLRGQLAIAEGDLEAAEAAFKRAVELDPDDAGAYTQLASFYRATGRLDEAVRIFRKSVEDNPGSARLHERLGILLATQGRTDEAMREYERAIELDDSLAESKNNLAYLLAETGGDLDRALDLAQEAKALRPDNPNTADTLGWVLYKRGIPSAAIGYLREAAAGMSPDEPALAVVRHHLALAYEQNEQPDKALETIDAALKDLPSGSDDEPEWVGELRAMAERLRSTSS